MIASVVADITKPYSAIESWSYDRFIAPAVASFYDRMEAEILGDTSEGASLLDVGCGGGHLLAAIAERRGDLRLTGVDLSPEQVERARTRAKAFAERVSIDVGSALELPYPEGTFDVVVSVASIKHWPDPRRGLSECVRVLRSGGRLHVVEADRGCKHADAAAFAARTRFPSPLHPLFLMAFRTWVAGQSFDLAEMRELAEGFPLQDVSVERVVGTPGLRLDARKA